MITMETQYTASVLRDMEQLAASSKELAFEEMAEQAHRLGVAIAGDVLNAEGNRPELKRKETLA
jgi:hypothetical protein